mmetsp:Transcript_22629/g.28553  ORF Transcript_22629/g.28553 Transcript_22629/m.28553 type:complete len:232 (+) Transcript_22629:154-849(+)|eukprot:CAMPEP_0203644760 /NCGR_PEP_ID=MMETSP0088-20131115/10104_1 /ASSEMBLY_ACC=CAM_ASM_001087 /TAXON_ID=426623 /ORGANISM="Chaetoceros affinis, Strain CCMP159" /LENGTH=231 /DNA_ID=CAMNT_0050501355 /DNA_START=109 /DNA_END=804 /DNA_ORIENTATION=+
MEQSDHTSISLSECSDQNCSEEPGTTTPTSLKPGEQQIQPRSQAEKKMDRILANRRSARRSRERRKKLQQNLEISVAFLSRQNEDLSRENNMLKQELRLMINLVNQMNKQGPLPPPSQVSQAHSHTHTHSQPSVSAPSSSCTESLLEQVRLAAAANGAANSISSAPSAAPSPVDSVVNLQASLLPPGAGTGAASEGGGFGGSCNNLSSEQVLALSQLLNQSQHQQPRFFSS